MHSDLNGLFLDKNTKFYPKLTRKEAFLSKMHQKIDLSVNIRKNGYFQKSGYFVEISITKI